MRKKLALLLVLALVISLVPMSAFAASDNGITKVVKVKDDAKLNDAKNAPMLRIEDDKGDFGKEEAFTLKLENAIWLEKGDKVTNTEHPLKDATDFKLDSNAEFEKVMEEEIKDSIASTYTAVTVKVNRRTSTLLEVTIEDATNTLKDIEFRIPMLVEMDGKGDAKVTIDSRESAVSAGTYTFAVGAAGDTITTIDGVKSFADTCDVKTITIDEAAVEAMGEGAESKIELRLPSNFKWKDNPDARIKFSTGLSGAAAYYDDGATITILNTDINGDYEFNADCYKDNNLVFYVDLSGVANRSTRGSIQISGLKLEAKKNAKYGDVKMTVRGDDVTREDVLIAKYVDYDIVVEATDDPVELFSGRFVNDTDEDQELVGLLIKEEVAGSWLTSRKTRVEFPSWVKIAAVEVDDSDGFDSTAITGLPSALERGEDYIEFTLESDNSGDKKELELIFYVSIEAGKSGDIEAVVGGRALDGEETVVLGKAITPVDVEVKTADIRTGIKKQALNDIVITENDEEAIQKGDLKIELEEGAWTEVPEIEVTEGDLDLDIDGAKVNGGVLTIKVKNDSSKASTIVISDAKIDLDRTIAEGNIELYITGDAVVTNFEDDVTLANKDIAFKEDAAATAVVAKVVTPADSDVGVKDVVFTIDESTFIVDGEEVTMDTAPYIKDGRTMLPIRYVAQALGVPEDNVIWNAATRTVTIFKGDRAVFITIGSAELKVNGTPLYMDTVAEIKDGRTMLPISFIGKALGAKVTWDADARTVTVN